MYTVYTRQTCIAIEYIKRHIFDNHNIPNPTSDQYNLLKKKHTVDLTAMYVIARKKNRILKNLLKML